MLALLVGCTLTPATEPHPYYALDGDTITVASGPSIRLARIDAPELPGHCRPGCRCVSGDPYLAREQLQAYLDEGDLVCYDTGEDYYGRRLADCTIVISNSAEPPINLSDAMLASGTVGLYQRN